MTNLADMSDGIAERDSGFTTMVGREKKLQLFQSFFFLLLLASSHFLQGAYCMKQIDASVYDRHPI